MSTFLNAVHVLLAVLVVGPLVAAPLVARRAVARREPRVVRLAANQAALFGAGSVVVALLGVATVLTGDRWTMTTPWVLISATLVVVALGLTWGYLVPALRRAAAIAASPGPADGPAPGPDIRPDGDAGPEGDTGPQASATPRADAGREEARRLRLDRIAARITGAGWLLVLTYAAIVVLMTVRPFS
ncbi:MAG: hypothetical protein FWJ70_13480 [Micromonosporaceae bacterium]|mgnify:CR=1 FL=1